MKGLESPNTQEEKPSESEKGVEWWNAHREKWNTLAENSVFPLEHVTRTSSHVFGYIQEKPELVDESLKKMVEDVSKIDTQKLTEVMSLSEDDDFRELRSRAIDTIGHLFDKEYIYYPSNNEQAENFETFRNLLADAKGRALPAIDSMVGDGAFLKQLHDDVVSEKFVHDEMRFIKNVSTFLNQENQKLVYEFFRKLGVFSEPLRIIKCHPKIIDLVGKYGNEDEIALIENEMFDAFLAKVPREPNGFGAQIKLDWIKKIASVQREGTFKMVNRVFGRIKVWFRETYNLELVEITKKEVIKLIHWPDTLGTIATIEAEHKGGSKMLSDNYGIHCFFRYPAEVLLRQIDEESKNLPYGIILTAYSDHNNAFSGDQMKLETLKEKLGTKNITFKIMEAGSGIDFMKRLIQLNNKFGSQNRISFLIINAHGQEDNFLLSNTASVKSSSVDKSAIEGKGVQRMKDFFIQKPEIILLSCSTGAEGGIGQKISEKFDAHVVAPSQPTGLKDVSVEFDAKNMPHFNVVFSEEGVLRDYGIEEN